MAYGEGVFRLIGEQDIKEGVYDIIGDTMEWAFEKDGREAEAMNYIFGMYDLAQNLLRRIKENQ